MSENIPVISEITSTIDGSPTATSATVASSSGIDDQRNKNNYKNNDNGNNNESLPLIKLPFPPKIDPSDLIHPAKPVTNISAFDEPHKPSRAPNAFIIYRKAFVKAARDEGHCLPMTVISSMASAAWEKESEKVKTEYKRISKEAHLKKKAMYPKERRRRRKERWNVVSFQQPNIIKHHENNEDQYNNNNNNNRDGNNNNFTMDHNNSNNNNGYYLPPESPIFTSQYTQHLIDLFSTPHISMLENYEPENNNINNNNNNNNNQYSSMVVINNNFDAMVNSLINNENANNNDLFQLQQQRSGDFSYLNLLNAVTTPDLSSSSSSSDENCSNLSSPSLPNDDESVIINCNENDTYNIYPDVNLFNFNIADIYSTPNDLLNKLDDFKSSPSTLSSSPRLSTSANVIINNSNTSRLLPSFLDNVPEFNSEFNYSQL